MIEIPEREPATYYRNDIMQNTVFKPDEMKFYDAETERMYNDLKDKTTIDVRIEFAKHENFSYFNLSNLGLTNRKLEELFSLSVIQDIMNKIEFLDLSHNNLTYYNYYNVFPNITKLEISFNKIEHSIETDILQELSCSDNKIPSIDSPSIILLQASNNKLESINVPFAQCLRIENNKITSLGEMPNLNYLDCCKNKIKTINHLVSLEELFIADNEIEKFSCDLVNLVILDCARNPVKRITYMEKLKELTTSTNVISQKYNVISIIKIKEVYDINIMPISLEERETLKTNL